MNREWEEGNRGVHIKPTARKSIHSECNSAYHKNMGRYGFDTVNSRTTKGILNQNRRTIQEQGSDEVDNVMSKMQKPSSPVLIEKNHLKQRRNSYDIGYYESNSDDDTSDNDIMLSKSSPAAFSIYSDELYTSANITLPQIDHQNSGNVSEISRGQVSPQRALNGSANSSQNHTTYSNKTGHQINKREKSSLQFALQAVLVIACIFIGAIYNLPTIYSVKTNSNYNKLSFYNDVKYLGEKYKVTDSSILQVRTGISTIFENKDTGAFIFAYNSKISNFNSVKFNSFVEDIAITASKYLRNNTKAIQHVFIDTSNLKIQTAKEFMNEYEDGVTKTGVMLVKDVDNVPSDIAMAFHYYCDEYSPLVKSSAIFFTLNLAKCSNGSAPKSTHEFIEKCLAKRWDTIEEDKIGPLLTRVVNMVVDATNI